MQHVWERLLSSNKQHGTGAAFSERRRDPRTAAKRLAASKRGNTPDINVFRYVRADRPLERCQITEA
jgi:hypothetical protein